MSSATQVELSYVKEVTWGTTPASALKKLRFTDESLSPSAGTQESNEIRADRATADVVRTSLAAAGGINGEMSYGVIDDLLEGCVYKVWGAAATSGAITLTFSQSAKTVVRGSGSFVTDGFAVGNWVLITGAVNSANNGYHRITAVVALTITLGQSTLVDESNTANVTVKHSGFLVNGATDISFSLEKKFADIASTFHAYKGAKVGTLELAYAAGGSMSTWGMTFEAKTPALATSTIGNGSYTAAPTGKVFSPVRHVTQISEGGAVTTLGISNVSVSFNNNLRSNPVVGSESPFAIPFGKLQITGRFAAYFANNALFQKFIDYTESSLSWRYTGDDGKSLIICLPSLHYTEANVVAGGADSDVMCEVGFTAVLNAASGNMVEFTRVEP